MQKGCTAGPGADERPAAPQPLSGSQLLRFLPVFPRIQENKTTHSGGVFTLDFWNNFKAAAWRWLNRVLQKWFQTRGGSHRAVLAPEASLGPACRCWMSSGGSPQLKAGGQLQGFAHSPGSPISVPSSSPGQLIKATSLFKEMNCTTDLHKDIPLRGGSRQASPTSFPLPPPGMMQPYLTWGNHGSWIVQYNNCCILVILYTFSPCLILSQCLPRLTAVVSNGVTETGTGGQHLGYSSLCQLRVWIVTKIRIWRMLEVESPLAPHFSQIPVCIPIDFSINNVD